MLAERSTFGASRFLSVSTRRVSGVRIKILGRVRVDLPVHRNIRGRDHTAAAHGFDARVVEAFGQAWAHRDQRMTVEDPQICRRDVVEEEGVALVDGGAEARA